MSKKNSEKADVCNQDCFNCIFEDCVNDAPYLSGEREQSDLIDEQILLSRLPPPDEESADEDD